jgi:hypothetical protein
MWLGVLGTLEAARMRTTSAAAKHSVPSIPSTPSIPSRVIKPKLFYDK